MSNIRKGLTQKEFAKKFDVSISTVKKYASMDRKDYEQEALERRKRAYELREKGLSWKDIAEAMGLTYNAVTSLAKRYKQQDLINQ
ncbi:sigma factor-like helix-turn-helix DNA-binding protein [Providencia rettgeri]